MNRDLCAKDKLKPWFIGLAILVVVIIGWILFGKDWKQKDPLVKEIAAAAQNSGPVQAAPDVPADPTVAAQPLPPDPAAAPAVQDIASQQYSYSAIVQMVRPCVVGISLTGTAQPFMQALQGQGGNGQQQLWPSKDAEGTTPPGPAFQPQAFGTPGINTLSMTCPYCGSVVTRQPGTPWSSVVCPNCGGAMAAPAPQPQQVAQTTTKDEYLSCPNCSLRIEHQPGIPWSGAKCPSCGTTLARVISVQQQQPAQQQTWTGTVQQQQQQQKSFQQVALPPNPQCPGACPGCPLGTPQLPSQPVAAQQPQNALQTQQNSPMGNNTGVGSGIVISPKGYILTNSHLLNGQNTVTVTLFTDQGMKQVPGRVVANLEDRDLAVVKIDPLNLNLTAIRIGNSDTVRTGDDVLALGNPFGLSQTVTSGIVSAIRQSIIIEGHTLTDIIQTDAPINQGNSGGPLVNMNGEAIGVNTAIYSPGQTNTGLGFAVPINQAKEVFTAFMDIQQQPAKTVAMQNLSYSRARSYPMAGTQGAAQTPPAAAPADASAWMGINMQVMNSIIAEQLKIPVDNGIIINEVYINSPAAAAGLQRGDVIIRFDNQRVTGVKQLRDLLAGKKPGDTVRLVAIRDRKKLDITVKTYAGARQQSAQKTIMKQKKINLLKGAEIETGSAELVTIGFIAITLTPEVAFANGIPENTQGVVALETEGLALQAGMVDGDIIRAINGKSTPDLLSVLKTIKRCNVATGITFSLIRQGQPCEVFVKENKPALLPKGL